MGTLGRMHRLTGSLICHRASSSLATASGRKDSNLISFEDHRAAYAHLSRAEVLRAWATLKLCSWDFVVQNSLKFLEHGERALGRGLLERILRPTLYDQFVAGNDPSSLKQTAARLKSLGIKLMVLPSLEEDVGGDVQNAVSKYESNAEVTLQLAQLTADHGGPLSCLQTKITAIINPDIMMKIASHNTDEESFYKTVSSWANRLSGGTGPLVPAPFLTGPESLELERGLDRLKRIGKAASDHELRLLVDGEFTYLNRAISIAALSMAGAFNSGRPVVWNTYQCYLKDAFNKIRGEMDVTKRIGVSFGAKVVRGAYLERERAVSRKEGYPDPTNPSYEATSVMYDGVVEFMLEQVAQSAGKKCNVIFGSHNESSVLKALSKMDQLGIKPGDNTVVFGQIYGMASNITVKLASEDYIVYNSVPYGSLFDVLPYLSRRATENRAVLKGTRRERILLSKELRSRFLGF